MWDESDKQSLRINCSLMAEPKPCSVALLRHSSDQAPSCSFKCKTLACTGADALFHTTHSDSRPSLNVCEDKCRSTSGCAWYGFGTFGTPQQSYTCIGWDKCTGTAKKTLNNGYPDINNVDVQSIYQLVSGIEEPCHPGHRCDNGAYCTADAASEVPCSDGTYSNITGEPHHRLRLNCLSHIPVRRCIGVHNL